MLCRLIIFVQFNVFIESMILWNNKLMNLRHLEHFLALLETGSFSQAAERLFITQSALSRSLQNLEETLGGLLIERHGKRNEVTPLGREVALRARHIVHAAQDLKRSTELLTSGSAGEISLGLGSGPGALLMTPFLCFMAESHPAVKVKIFRGSTELQVQQLRDRELDALVVDMRRVTPAPDLSIENLGLFPTGFLCRPDHPLVDQGELRLDDVLQYPLASTPLSAEIIRLYIERCGPAADLSQRVTLQCEEISSLIETAKRSKTILVGILGAARHELGLGELVKLPVANTPNAGAQFAYVTLLRRVQAPALGWFKQFVEDELSLHRPASTSGG